MYNLTTFGCHLHVSARDAGHHPEFSLCVPSHAALSPASIPDLLVDEFPLIINIEVAF